MEVRHVPRWLVYGLAIRGIVMRFELFCNFNDDVIDVRDIMERVEYLRYEREQWCNEYLDAVDAAGDPEEWDAAGAEWAKAYPDDGRELGILEDFLASLAGCGGDELWEGDWYPVTLVNADYFTEYARDMAEESMGAGVNVDAWPFNYIDWEAAARDLQQFYSCVELTTSDGTSVTFYYCW